MIFRFKINENTIDLDPFHRRNNISTYLINYNMWYSKSVEEVTNELDVNPPVKMLLLKANKWRKILY